MLHLKTSGKWNGRCEIPNGSGYFNKGTVTVDEVTVTKAGRDGNGSWTLNKTSKQARVKQNKQNKFLCKSKVILNIN